VHQFAELIAPSRLGRSFRWLLASSWLTNLGDGITLAAGPLLVASQTHNPLAVAMAVFLQRLPWLMFGLYAGVLADRLDRRAIVIATGLVRVAILLLLTASILTHRVDVGVVLAALFLFGVTETFGDTTSTTLLPMLVARGGAGCGRTPRCGRWRSRSSPSTSPSAPPGRCWFFTRVSGWAWARSASG
jgi:hypothetical protein